MSDIVIRASKWLLMMANPARPATDKEVADGALLLDEAVVEIYQLRITLGKIARLGSNASKGSPLDECCMLAFSVLNKERIDA